MDDRIKLDRNSLKETEENLVNFQNKRNSQNKIPTNAIMFVYVIFVRIQSELERDEKKQIQTHVQKRATECLNTQTERARENRLVKMDDVKLILILKSL